MTTFETTRFAGADYNPERDNALIDLNEMNLVEYLGYGAGRQVVRRNK